MYPSKRHTIEVDRDGYMRELGKEVHRGEKRAQVSRAA
jgi:hypothetical protein